MGQRPKRQNHEDGHYKKDKLKNWWEDDGPYFENKTKARRDAIREALREINE